MPSRPINHTIRQTGEPAAEARLNEVASLLAAGILRLRLNNAASGRQPQKTSQNRLDSCADQSVHASRTRV